MSFASKSVSLAMLEYLAHIDWSATRGDDLVLIEAEIAEADVVELPITDLPSTWRESPRPRGGTRRIGDDWLASGRSVGLSVPSVIVPIERNILINPLHPGFGRLAVIALQSFAFDERLRDGPR